MKFWYAPDFPRVGTRGDTPPAMPRDRERRAAEEMERAGYFLAGFASGWAVRTTVDSSRTLAVKVISACYGIADRATRAVSMEREHLEDLFAEARAQYQADRDRAAHSGARPKPAGVERGARGRAA
jgi:hypothetical protein